MRTTIDLPTDLHTVAREMAHQQRTTLSQVITDLIRLGLRPIAADDVRASSHGLPAIRVGRPITAEDVRSLEDE